MKGASRGLGAPDQILSDNGPQFMSGVFKSFVKENGVRHVTGTHPTIQQPTA